MLRPSGAVLARPHLTFTRANCANTIYSLGSSGILPIDQTFSEKATRLSRRYTAPLPPQKRHACDRVGYVKARHTACTGLPFALSRFTLTALSYRRVLIFTPVCLGFPREIVDGAIYMGHNIPKGIVCSSFRQEMTPARRS